MCLGRVPVVISDAWQPPPGIPWQEFSVPIPERDVASIPIVLEELENKAQPMGKLARQVFDEHFAPGIFLDRLLTTLISKYACPSRREQSAHAHGVFPDCAKFGLSAIGPDLGHSRA